MQQTTLVAPKTFTQTTAPIPTPDADEVLVRVAYVGVCGSDISAYFGRHPYVHPPIVLGHEFSGIVTARGGTGGLAIGTRVTALPHLGCRTCRACRAGRFNLCHALRVIGCQAPGAHAEYVRVPADMAVPLPEAISLEDGALVEPAAVAFHAMRRAAPAANDKVLVLGAGPIGNFAMQCARVLGAGAVYVADLDPGRTTLATALGADGVINLSTETLDDGLARLAGGPEGIDLFVDCVGAHGEALEQLLQLAPRGSRLLVPGLFAANAPLPSLPNLVEHELTLIGTAMYVPQDYTDVLAHLAAGRLRTDGLVTHRFSRADIPAAFAMIDARREPFFKVIFTADNAKA